jgi:hypothetical protein
MKMLNHKAGDTVRIQPQEWIDAQEKDNGIICLNAGDIGFAKNMFRYAGKIAKITRAHEEASCYELDIDNEESWWQDWMFDPSYNPADIE